MHPQSICSVPDCSRPFYAREFCKLHYNRWMRNGQTEVLPTRKKPPEEPRICACGCGEVFIPKRRPSRPQTYIYGHYSRLPRKPRPKAVSKDQRTLLYEAAGYRCEQCGLPMAEQVERYGRRLEIHHKNHDHSDNTPGNHEVLCTACHNKESLSVRDEAKKAETWRERYEAGEIRMWSTGKTKETDRRLAAMAEKKLGRTPWNKKYASKKESKAAWRARKKEGSQQEPRP